jgi:hypothetical protein
MRSRTARRPRHPRARSPRGRARLAAVLSTLGALLLAVTVVWQSASASFTDGTAAVRATASTATVALVDDDAGSKLFSVGGLKPGSTATQCIVVTSTSTVPVDVRLYVTGRSSSNQLSSWVKLAVKTGSGGSSSSCSGFTASPTTAVFTGALSAFPADSWDVGVQGWTTATPATGTTLTEKRTYQVTYTLDASTPSSVQSGAATASFVWESRKR